jgi:hypothetical protein
VLLLLEQEIPKEGLVFPAPVTVELGAKEGLVFPAPVTVELGAKEGLVFPALP